MDPQSASFESYVNSLAELGVFPAFSRFFNGWTCELKNGANQRLMPFKHGEYCWAQTMVESLASAVTGLNTAFPNPKDLHQYIATAKLPGEDRQTSDFPQTAKSAKLS